MAPVIGRLNARLGPSAPAWTAFLVSLVLSAIAVGGSSVLNRDGMLYVDAAHTFLADGYPALLGSFDWPLLPMLIAGLGKLTGIDLETAGQVVNGLFLAGACALMVDLARRHPQGDASLAWATCLVVLAMPGYNGYRDQLLREYGYWFFAMLAFWLALRWERAGCGWRDALFCQLALVAAMLFRLEAVVFFLALMAWQATAAPAGERIRRVAAVAALPLLTLVLLVLLDGAGLIDWPARVLRYLNAANLLGAHNWSEHAARLVSAGILPEYSRKEAGYILFFGMLSLIPIKFIKMLGAFLVPFAYPAFVGAGQALVRRWALLAWAFLAHVLALMLFAADLLFLSSRYVSMLTLLVVPMVATGLLMLLRRWPRWRWAIIGTGLVTMLANVVSLAPGQTHLSAAGAWLATHSPDSAQVYVEDPRVAYYAGWGFAGRKRQVLDRQALAQAAAKAEFSMLALSDSQRMPWVDAWLAASGLQAIGRFDNGAGEAVVIVRVPPPMPAPAQAPVSASESPERGHLMGNSAE
jgi:hypothetical protein